MTANQINYAAVRETRRSNLAKEAQARSELAETRRHNVAYETETARHNTSVERETVRHNIAGENISYLNHYETVRHNVRAEDETERHNVRTELQTDARIADERRNTEINLERARIYGVETLGKTAKNITSGFKDLNDVGQGWVSTFTGVYKELNHATQGAVQTLTKGWHDIVGNLGDIIPG